MGEHTKIQWCHHTFNPWWGCAKVSPACLHCYAESVANRFAPGHWGRAQPRRMFGAKHWAEPLRWNRAAAKAGERRRVFCGSMCDVFEALPGRKTISEARAQLWALITATPHLTWLLLTKRPWHVELLVPWTDWPKNVWLGVTVEDQKRADGRIPALLAQPAVVRFISCEPLLAPVYLTDVPRPELTAVNPRDGRMAYGVLPEWQDPDGPQRAKLANGIDWVICGAEAGPGARPMDLDWARSLRNQCQAAEVPYFLKQAVVDGRKVSMPELDGRQWAEVPSG